MHPAIPHPLSIYSGIAMVALWYSFVHITTVMTGPAYSGEGENFMSDYTESIRCLSWYTFLRTKSTGCLFCAVLQHCNIHKNGEIRRHALRGEDDLVPPVFL